MSLVFAVDGIECDLRRRGAAFEGVSSARVVDEDPSHDLRGDSEELRPVLPGWMVLLDQTDERLMNECRGLQRVADPFTS